MAASQPFSAFGAKALAENLENAADVGSNPAGSIDFFFYENFGVTGANETDFEKA